jgi:hypothetical protein
MPVEALGPTVGQNLIFALNDLTTAQNNLMSVVLNYYTARMILYRDLGIMELDDCGMWIDKPLEEAVALTEDECPMPPSVPIDWLEDAGVDPRELKDGPAPAGGPETVPAGEPAAESVETLDVSGGAPNVAPDGIVLTAVEVENHPSIGLQKLPPVAGPPLPQGAGDRSAAGNPLRERARTPESHAPGASELWAPGGVEETLPANSPR